MLASLFPDKLHCYICCQLSVMLPYHLASILLRSLAIGNQTRSYRLQRGAPESAAPKSLQLRSVANAAATERVPLFDRKSISKDAQTPPLSGLRCHVQLPIWQVRGPDGVVPVQQISIPAGLVTIRRLHSKTAAS